MKGVYLRNDSADSETTGKKSLLLVTIPTTLFGTVCPSQKPTVVTLCYLWEAAHSYQKYMILLLLLLS